MFIGQECDTSCEKGKWGEKCELDCNCGEGDCDQQKGICRCPAGKTGENCQHICPEGTFGIGCAQRCPSCKNGMLSI